MFRIPTILGIILLASCSPAKKHADLIIHHAHVYSVDSKFTIYESFAVADGKILALGKSDSILKAFEAPKIIDAHGACVYPGFIDSHCHFVNYGLGLQQVDLVGTNSFEEVIQKVLDFRKNHPGNKSDWIVGRGWDQNDWVIKEFPERSKLDSLFPDTPVYLTRVDGHAALVNGEALKRAGIKHHLNVEGGTMCIRSWEGRSPEKMEIEGPLPIQYVSGLLVDNATDLVAKVIPPPDAAKLQQAMLDAQKNCFAVGLTTVDDAGLEKKAVELIDTLQKEGKLKMRVYAMLSDNEENFSYYLDKGPYKTERLNVRSFKFYADGALGSRGACLLKPYSDKPGQQGFLLHKPSYYREKAKLVFEKEFQMNTHAIGDSAVRLMLQIYGEALRNKNDARWRIEHAQVVDKKDVTSFGTMGVIPSVQPTHATSDMYWAGQRLGPERIKTAYAYKDLETSAGKLALGTDFPVEDISPFKTFYAAVFRMDTKGIPKGGFQTENAISREDALRGMTINGAFANFEEKEKGSLEPGKDADFILLDEDLMKCAADKIPGLKARATYIKGERVYGE